MFKIFGKLALITVLTLLGGNVIGQVKNFSGVVTDSESKKPIAFAKIVLKESNKGAESDDKGMFSIAIDFSTGNKDKTLIIRSSGFQDLSIPININSNPVLTVVLIGEVISLNEVVISSSRVSEKIMESPVSIQKLTSQQILSTSSGNFYEGFKILYHAKLSKLVRKYHNYIFKIYISDKKHIPIKNNMY